MLAGVLLLVFRPKVKQFVGNIGFAERYLGSGGTWTFLALLGVALFIIGLMWALGTFQSIFNSTLGSFFGA